MQKKLLLLGGSRYLLPVIKAAHKLGIYVVTCDYLPDNIAHSFSDKYCNASIIDKELILGIAQQLKIDGIMSFACDPGVVTASYVADRLGLPNVGPYESVCILQNKGRFRKFLAEHGFNVPTAQSYVSIRDALKDAGIFHWPVVVKPTDSAGSKGVIKVDVPTELEKSIRYALSFSHCNEFIIEDFLQQKGLSSDTDSFSVDGELKFISFNSQWFDAEAQNPYTPAAFSWPSTISHEHQKELACEIQRLLRLLNMGTSIYNIETREAVDGKAYIMEVSPRGGGNRLAECLKYVEGVDLIENAVRAATGLPLLGFNTHEPKEHGAEIILHGDEEGIFDGLWISDEIKGYVLEKDIWISKGEKVRKFSAANESIGTLMMNFDTQEQMLRVFNNMKKYVQVRVI